MNEPVQDKAPKPPGLLPKNVQSWLLISVALLMVLIMWLTGAKKPRNTKPASLPTLAEAPYEVNEAKIAELQTRIQDLQRQQLAAQSALAQQSRLLGAAPPEPSSGQPLPGGSQPVEAAQDPIRAERKKRNYFSLFASNVAVSYRKTASSEARPGETALAPANVGTPIPSSPESESAQLAQLLKEMPSGPPLTSTAASTNSPPDTSARRKEDIKPAPPNLATGKTYILFEGTILETVLVNRLEGQFAGPVECLLTTDAYSHDRQHLLLPSGTKLLGETKKVDNLGQSRLAVFFHRLIMPDGYSVNLDQFKGLDQVGATGLRDQVNNHYLRIFGASLAIGALGAVAQAGTGGVLTQSGTDRMREGLGTSFAQSSAQILDRFLNVPPTVTIREGHRVKVYLSGDLPLPDYNHHTMPSDL
jgi:type IV secretory pathway VirB10-like protein